MQRNVTSKSFLSTSCAGGGTGLFEVKKIFISISYNSMKAGVGKKLKFVRKWTY